MSFRFAGISKSPSTPNRKNRSLFSQPSTTPAGPPPTYLSNVSTTPAGPPPQSVYGSSFNAGNNTFGRKGTPGRRGFHMPSSSPPVGRDEDEDGYEFEEEDEEEDAPGEVEDEDAEMEALPKSSPSKSAFMSSIMKSPRGLKRSRNGKVREQRESEMPAVARGIIRQARPAQMHEPDDVILRGEEIVSRLESGSQQNPAEFANLLTDASTQLTALWTNYTDATTKEGGVGPASKDALAKANYLASLLLQLHHPHTAVRPAGIRLRNSTALMKRPGSCHPPRALLDWLDVYHNPFPDDFETIHRHLPSPADHDRFWDAIYASLSRGKFDRVIRLLRDAGWQHAITALEDYPNSREAGYGGRQLENIYEVVERCVRILETCPALTGEDWDVRGADWTLFRQRARQGLKNLEIFAGEDEVDPSLEPTGGNVFQASAQEPFSFSAASKRAESKVPWSVYENLKLVYGLVLGGVDELLDTSQDWVEASIFLTVWWDGEDENTSATNFRQSGMRSSQKPREVDVTPLSAYRTRLADAFALVTAEAEETDPVFSINTMDPVQVGLACVMESSVESVIGITRTWSLPVTYAVAEIAAFGGWLPQAGSKSRGLLGQEFSSEDLMVLSHGSRQQKQQPGEIERDELLGEYADVLGQKDVFTGSQGKLQREGWELAVSVLGRMDDESVAQRKIGELVDQIELTDEAGVDKVLKACSDLDLAGRAQGIAERYADNLASSTQAYGSALVFYARARATAKLKGTLGLLISMCLLQSAAAPAPSHMDGQLSSLLGKDRSGLIALARADPEAAALLSSHLSGYATIRRFYELRDQDVNLPPDQERALRPLERSREAAKALLAVTESAADCIRGGLFDPEVESVVAVDSLLALFGEALPLLGQRKRIFTRDETFTLLRIVEDFATAPGRVRDNAESLLQASIKAYRNAGSMSGLLQKSKSDVSSQSGLGGSSYDMLLSSVMMQSQEKSDAKHVDLRRGWDWRKGLNGVGGADVGGKEVLILVRLALAQEVAKGWAGMIKW